MRIEKIEMSPLMTNCYILMNDETKQALIVDPAKHADEVEALLEKEGMEAVGVLLTHGHFDHIMAVPDLKEDLAVNVYAAEAERDMLADPDANLTASWTIHPMSIKADVWVKEGEEYTLGGMTFRVLETPGHTPGGVCFYFPEDKVLIAGDTLFRRSYGRCDLAGGDFEQMKASLRKLFTLPGDVVVYPGHGNITTIQEEADAQGDRMNR